VVNVQAHADLPRVEGFEDRQHLLAVVAQAGAGQHLDGQLRRLVGVHSVAEHAQALLALGDARAPLGVFDGL